MFKFTLNMYSNFKDDEMVAVCNYTLSNSGVYCLSLYNLLIKTTCCDFTNKRSSNTLKNRKSWMNINTLSINNFQQNASLQYYNQTGTINKLTPVSQLIYRIQYNSIRSLFKFWCLLLAFQNTLFKICNSN